MTVAVINYTDSAQMLADYAALRRRLNGPGTLPVVIKPAPEIRKEPRLIVGPPSFGGRARAGERWTDEEIDILVAMVADGSSARAIATKLRRTATGIQERATKLGLRVKLRPTKEIAAPICTDDLLALYKVVVDQDRSSAVRVRGIIKVCADAHGISVNDLLSQGRQPNLVIARRQAMWTAAKETKLSLTALGNLFNRDHTTILAAIRRENLRTGQNVRGCGVSRK